MEVLGVTDTGLLEGASIRRIADQLNLRPTKQRGQNFVTDPNTVRRIVNFAGVGPDDLVLEIGPGIGSLTLGLLETGARVVAVEIDDRLANQLPITVAERMPSASDRLQIISVDALKLTELPDPVPNVLVANLPYNVSVPVLLHVLKTWPTINAGLVMVQLEVADRLVAKPGSKTYGAPSAKLAWYGTAQRVGTVSPKVFWPVPNVDSGLVRFNRHTKPITQQVTTEEVFAVINAAFGQRRKMLRAALTKLGFSADKVQQALVAIGVKPTVRGETLDIAQFANIVTQLHKAR